MYPKLYPVVLHNKNQYQSIFAKYIEIYTKIYYLKLIITTMSKKVLQLLLVLFAGQIVAQNSSAWKSVFKLETSKLSRNIEHKNTNGEMYFTLNTDVLKQTLQNVSNVLDNTSGTIISIPNLNGDLEQYEIWENSNFDPILQAKYPDIRAYTGKGITDKTASINFSLAPIGIQTAVFRTGKDAEFIEAYDKAATVYVAFSSKNSHSGTTTFKCGVKDTPSNLNPIVNKINSSAGQLKTMRLAASCNGEYAQHFGGTVTGALAGINASMTRMNALFERDLAIHLNLIANNDILMYLNPATDPFSDGAAGSGGAWNAEAQNNLSAVIGNAAYDLGHLFCKTGGGGNAGCIGCVCEDDDLTDLTDLKKGAGFTAPESDTAAPAGDVFDYDFLAHEFGHQFGANHTFSYAFEDSGAQVEPGSGCATMGYAGVTNWDVQPHNMPQFATKSIEQIELNMSSKTCPVNSTTSETPIVNAGLDYTIPKGTAFLLKGTASDADANDVLTYSWEQNDSGTATTASDNSEVWDQKAVGPTFRINLLTNSLERYMPKLEYVLNGQLSLSTNWESISNVARTLNFTFTARDNHPGAGQTKTDAMVVNVIANAGPFEVSSQDTTGISYASGSIQTVTWNVNNTNTLAGSSTVNILLSTDGGLTFPTTLVSGVPNNGNAQVTIPGIAATACRIMIKPTANIYFAVNSASFAISNLATNDFTFSDFALYPNPNEGNFNLKFSTTSNSKITISINDISGRDVLSKSYFNKGLFNEKIQLTNIQSGIYLVNINDGVNNMTRKIVIR